MRRFMLILIVSLSFFQITAQEVKDKHHSVYFKPKLSVSFTDNRHVPGVSDGIYFNTDLDVVLNYKYKMEMNEFQTKLNTWLTVSENLQQKSIR